MARATAKDQKILFPEVRPPKEVFRYLRNYLAGQFVGATRDDALLDEVLKCLFCKLYMETGMSAEVPVGADRFQAAQHVREVFGRVRDDFPDIYERGAEILLDPASIAEVMEHCGFSLLNSESDPIGDAFEVFVGSESRGRAGQFFTPRSVTDFLVQAIEPKPSELVIDPACGAGGFLASVARSYVKSGTKARKLADESSAKFFGVDKDEYLSKLARLHISLLSGGHPNIICGDSIAFGQNGSGDFPTEFRPGKFDVVLTNPPFGTKIVAATPEVLEGFELARKWKLDSSVGKWLPTNVMQSRVPPQVLFVERCVSLLKNGGRLGMVLPESLLSNKSYRHVVEYIVNNLDIQGVIGMPESLFKTSGKGGTHTKTCLLIAKKTPPRAKRGKWMFMAEAKWCGHDSRARTIPNNDLPEIQRNLDIFKSKRKLSESTLGFRVEQGNVESRVLRPRYYDPEVETELRALEKTHRLVAFERLVAEGVLSVSTGDEVGKLAYGTGEIPFIRTSDISNWELKADPKHGVSREIYTPLKAKQDVQPGDILMVKDGTYLVGTCAIVSEYDQEIVFQSHLYKIRVNDNKVGINPYLLIAILSSSVVQRQVRAKQFTQDIIDSLGERISELVLPVPKSANTREKITQMVQTAVQERIEARELAKRARIEVLQ